MVFLLYSAIGALFTFKVYGVVSVVADLHPEYVLPPKSSGINPPFMYGERINMGFIFITLTPPQHQSYEGGRGPS